MIQSRFFLLRGVSWTILAYVLIQGFRFVTNIILTRLLAPELFGVVNIVYAVRNGIELLSDVGIGQNMVYHPDSHRPEFYNTAWTLQLIRGTLLWVASMVIALPIAKFYGEPLLAIMLPVASLPFLLQGAGSVGGYLAQKRMQFVRTNVFDIGLEFIGAAANVLTALYQPTAWALVIGNLVASLARMVASFFIVPDLGLKLFFSKKEAKAIIGFSKWVFVSSFAFFVAMSFDSLYLGKVSSLALLGVYGVARTLSQQVVNLVTRLSATFVFPIIASSAERSRAQLRRDVARARAAFLLAAAVVLAMLVVSGDLLVTLLYDARYHAAGSMLPVLVAGAWFAILSTVNESMLLGLGRPVYGAFANIGKLVWMVVGIPLAFAHYGPMGVVGIVGLSDLPRYAAVLVGQFREEFSFAAQDILITIIGVGFLLIFDGLRWYAGFGWLG
jgi:O-antigen/teichoic acid export membrane protein